MSAAPKNVRSAPTFGIETITPESAEQLLKRNTRNRPLAGATVRNYADEIAHDQWMFNGEAIKFDWDGVLVDGQHRLAAIALAGKPVDTLVVRGLNPEVFKTLDTGKARSTGDVLALRGIRYHTPISTAYRALYRYLGRGRAKRRITNTQLLELVDEFPDMVELAYECMKKPIDPPVIAPSSRIFFFYLAQRVDRKLARQFLAGIKTDMLSTPNAMKLRQRIEQVSREVIPPSAKVKWVWLVQAWNATVAGEVIARYSRAPAPVDFEPAPRFSNQGGG